VGDRRNLDPWQLTSRADMGVEIVETAEGQHNANVGVRESTTISNAVRQQSTGSKAIGNFDCCR
jgi:hypothetical protein